jgi:SpoVK/Ycf46/Vps4 family AAA+-type ATPase
MNSTKQIEELVRKLKELDENSVSRSNGLLIHLSGPAGSGKKLAAETIASKLEMSLYRVDLSTVVSKYIDETEKNLNKMFEWAEQSEITLFFDEADALFSRRTEAPDANNSYANIESDYLLQRIAAYKGIVILATNK